MSEIRTRSWLFSLFLLFACSDHSNEPVLCQHQSVTGGTERTNFLALRPEQELAVVAVRLKDSGVGVAALCSGTLISSNLVLTAAHCMSNTSATVGIGRSGFDTEIATEVRAVTVHPLLDLALLELQAAVPDGFVVEPILPSVSGKDVSVGRQLQIAGFGAIETGSIGTLHFAVESVQSMSDGHFEVSARSRAAACVGDSGGPALTRDEAGRVVVAGVLSKGSSSCTDVDSYVSLSQAFDWLVAVGHFAITNAPITADCDLIGAQGRCFENVSMWCNGRELISTACSADQRCGYSPSARGFRCAAPAEDSCGGVSDLGQCSGTNRLRCVDGTVTSTPCGACGSICEFSVHTGESICNSER